MKELQIYHDDGVITEELGKMLLEIATRFTNRPNWVGYPHEMKNDLISEAVLRMISQIHKFDITRDKPNPFAYFSQICFHKYIMEAKKYYKQINIQRDLCEHYIEEIECNANMDSNGFLKKALSERVHELD
jgi:DNA-directed RNA polymerase specialized sigma24 family protein